MFLNYKVRRATIADLSAIIALLADDELGKNREVASDGISLDYINAFEIIDNDPNAEIVVMTIEDDVIATAQVNYITYLNFQGGMRAQIESVRVHKNYRGQKLGEKLMLHIIEQAKNKGCHFVQLTTNKSRERAKTFYEKLGFVASHEGMKLAI